MQFFLSNKKVIFLSHSPKNRIKNKSKNQRSISFINIMIYRRRVILNDIFTPTQKIGKRNIHSKALKLTKVDFSLSFELIRVVIIGNCYNHQERSEINVNYICQ